MNRPHYRLSFDDLEERLALSTSPTATVLPAGNTITVLNEFATSYLSKVGDPNYNPAFDLNHNGQIGQTDAKLLLAPAGGRAAACRSSSTWPSLRKTDPKAPFPELRRRHAQSDAHNHRTNRAGSLDLHRHGADRSQTGRAGARRQRARLLLRHRHADKRHQPRGFSGGGSLRTTVVTRVSDLLAQLWAV